MHEWRTLEAFESDVLRVRWEGSMGGDSAILKLKGFYIVDFLGPGFPALN